MAEKDQKNLGRYKLLALLATGGMAEIHLAQQAGIKGFERLVVVKKILPHLASEEAFLEMFFDEARIASLLNHPNIVQIYDLGQDGDDYFMAMEYLEGESLSFLERESRKKEKYMPPGLAAGIIAQLCDGLDYAHSFKDHDGKTMNIVHRDVSPQNVIVLFSGGIKLVDFGIAKAASKMHKTRVGTIKGKLSYLPPEQCLGKAVDQRSDIFSLGIILWELLTRRRLFKRDNEGATLNAVLNEEIPKVRKVRPVVPAELEQITMRALQKEPKDRYPSAGEMGAALRKYLLKSGEAAGTSEIAAFINGALGERAQNKKSMLERVRTSDNKEVDVTMLNPESSQSMPSRSRIEELPTPTDPAKVVAKIKPPAPPIEELFTPPPEKAPGTLPRKKLPTAFWGALAGLLVGLGLVLVWAISKDISTKDEQVQQAAIAPKPETPGPDAPPEPEKARLTVHSDPSGCQAWLNGAVLPGKTPIDDLAVDPGKEHSVAVVCADRREEIKTIAGKPGERLRLDFTPEPVKAVSKPEYGFLRVDTDPWSEVYLGRRRLGVTPILRKKMRVGRYRLTFVNQDEGVKKSVSVKIRPGKTTKVVRKLKP
ncbi:serine/threonine protein kinase [Myxococcota bacterium]